MPESTSYRTFLQQFTQSHRQRSHLQLQAIQPWRSGMLVVSYIRGLRMFGLARGTVDQRVLACPTSRKTSSMSAIVWGPLGAGTRCEKEMSCSRGQADYLQHPINLLLRGERQTPISVERKKERAKKWKQRFHFGRRETWLLVVETIWGEWPRDTRNQSDKGQPEKKRNKRKHWGDNGGKEKDEWNTEG